MGDAFLLLLVGQHVICSDSWAAQCHCTVTRGSASVTMCGDCQEVPEITVILAAAAVLAAAAAAAVAAGAGIADLLLRVCAVCICCYRCREGWQVGERVL
jgi:hypothetical protein